MAETRIPTIPNQPPLKVGRMKWTPKELQNLIKICKRRPELTDDQLCTDYNDQRSLQGKTILEHKVILSRMWYLRKRGKVPAKYKRVRQ